MIRHSVLWTLHAPASARHVKTLLESCRDLVAGTEVFEVGIRSTGLEANADVALYAMLRDAAALAACQAHPAHQEVRRQIGALRLTCTVLDSLP